MPYIRKDDLTKVRLNASTLFRSFNEYQVSKLNGIIDEMNEMRLTTDVHPLFFLLRNDDQVELIQKSINSIFQYDQNRYRNKIFKKLINSTQFDNLQAAIAEIQAAGFYCKKFFGIKNISVAWEEQEKGPDIIIRGYDNPIIIEVTTRKADKRILEQDAIIDKVREALEISVIQHKIPKYKYIFSIFQGTIFKERDISEFVNFVKKAKRVGTGKYQYKDNGEVKAEIKIALLNTSKREYVTGIGPCGVYWLEDNRLIRETIVRKARSGQLLKNAFNFVCIANMQKFDQTDFEEGFLGKESYGLDGRFLGRIGRIDNRRYYGANAVVEKEALPIVHGVIYFDWDYTRKKIINTINNQPPKIVLDILS